MLKLFTGVLVSAALLTGCDSITGKDKDPSITGQWTAAIDGEAVMMTLSEKDQQITGSGSWGGDAISVTGTHVHPNVSMVVEFARFQPVNFQGSFVDDNQIRGSATGSGFGGQSITLNRNTSSR